ncbi:MAG: DUF2304 family protein [bacterium]
MLILAKILSAIFALVVLSRSIVDYREKKESLQMTVFWIVVWLAITAIAFFPFLVSEAIKLFGGNRTGLGTVFGMGLIFVMFITYRVYVKANRIEKHVAKLSREIAIHGLENIKTTTHVKPLYSSSEHRESRSSRQARTIILRKSCKTSKPRTNKK